MIFDNVIYTRILPLDETCNNKCGKWYDPLAAPKQHIYMKIAELV
jgi:hypothetical protein